MGTLDEYIYSTQSMYALIFYVYMYIHTLHLCVYIYMCVCTHIYVDLNFPADTLVYTCS